MRQTYYGIDSFMDVEELGEFECLDDAESYAEDLDEGPFFFVVPERDMRLLAENIQAKLGLGD